MAKKSEKKKNIGLRRRVRKTLGATCLITALLVAAIPVPEASAQVAAESKLTWVNEIGSKNTSQIPLIPTDCKTIYTTDDGRYQFAWVKASGDAATQYIAVILGYNGGTLTDGNLVIPDKVDAYTKFSENEGTGTGYVAVSQNQKPLYYMSKVVYIQDPSGNDTEEIDYDKSEYSPCYTSDKDKWMYVGEGAARRERPLDDFYYPNGSGGYTKTENSSEQWIRNVTVAYIGNQYLVANTATSNTDEIQPEWKVAEATYNTDSDKGIFANQINITNLTVGPDLIGIGNYAFYNCATLNTITLGNGIVEIGHHAFALCNNMRSIGLEFNSNLKYISDYTFYGCSALENFRLSAGVTKIYDHAFDGCENLKTMDLNGSADGRNTSLMELGYFVFNGCKALQDLVLPSSLTGSTEGSTSNAIHLNNFAGCTSLKRIEVLATALHLVADTPTSGETSATLFTVDHFKNSVDPTFFFEGEDVSNTHEYTKEHAIAFKYEGLDKYEIIIIEEAAKEAGGGDAKLTYQVNSQNQLLYFDMEKPVAEVTIPSTIGPYGVSTINQGSFGGGAGSCYLRKITIPATVTTIGENAFRGCHNLKHVIFQDASTIRSIGTNAFATQWLQGDHRSDCPNKGFLNPDSSGKVPAPKLTFTGAVGNDILPFTYAMSPTSNINQGAQPRTYITYYSGWPTNLEIRYVEDPDSESGGAATLVGYPTYTDLKGGLKYKEYPNSDYPYMTKEYADAAKDAIAAYEAAGGKMTELSDNQRQIINAALNVSVPSGVKRIAPGLFSNATSAKIFDEKNKEYRYTGEVEKIDEFATADKNILTVTFADIEEFEPYSFTGCTSLTTIKITGGEAKLDDYAFAWEYTKLDDGSEISNQESALTTVNMEKGGKVVGDYAFANNYNLTDVTLSATVEELGRRPFKDCPQLNDVDFQESPFFTTDKAIIYGLKNHEKSSIVQCLESRGTIYGGKDGGSSSSISAEETAGITSIAREAFMDCEGIGLVDLRSSKISSIPERAFQNTTQLGYVYLPKGTRAIENWAFHNSNVRYLEIPETVNVIQPSSFNTAENPRTDGKTLQMIEFYCEPDSGAGWYANMYDNINVTDKEPDPIECEVQFWFRHPDKDSGVPDRWLKTETVLFGENATPPDERDLELEGYNFNGWLPDYTNVTTLNLTVYTTYLPIDSSETMLTVSYWLDTSDEEPWKTYPVPYGGDAPNLTPPAKEGYTFMGWRGRQGLENITSDLDVYAYYVEGEVPGSNGGNGDGNGNGNGGNGSGNGNGTSSQMYTLTVRNGSGSGSYVEGATVIIVANEPASTQEFEKWTQEGTADLKMASTTISATTLVMPAANTTVTANYTTKQGGSGTGTGTGSGGSGSGSGGTTNKPTVSGNGGTTTVIIDKNGLSNTGVVSVSIKGSSDNFVLKISENTDATEAAIRALMAEFGSLDNIKYFPMDISLYDATGNTKITDTSGLSITITLPIPDSMITYAGNNRIAGVVNDRLDKLSPKFTTIDGVSCITFTAEHFSPYVMYVNTSNLESTGVTDSSPKTGDIHPKWFIALGLACMSVILFVKKDKGGKKVLVRA